MLKFLSAPPQFSAHFLAPGNRLPLPRAQIKNFNLPTRRTRKIVGLFAGKSHIKDLSALVATNRHRHWKLPFHKHLILLPNSARLLLTGAVTRIGLQGRNFFELSLNRQLTF